MCRAVTCRTCGLKTWAGCGAHVDQVLAGVPASKRCPGHEASNRAGGWLGRFKRPVTAVQTTSKH